MRNVLTHHTLTLSPEDCEWVHVQGGVRKSCARPRSRASKLMPGRKVLRHTTTTVFSALDVAYWALF